MAGQTIILRGDTQRQFAHQLIERAGADFVVNVRQPARNVDQNARMWAMLSDVSRAKPEGRSHTPDVWKSLMMNACGHAVQFVNGLDGEPFPVGFRSSRLTKTQMSELIEFIFFYGAQHGIVWSEPSGS